ncbi:phenylalanine--tRNA ligase subunit beta [Curvibacter sp. CHRR-16]|uniref:phenylalanine--tRNA ligase subunit beta n=1 Tax=Curvibacter sp. CHRR-16 TaxID=2835872 RepID=UPI001BDA01C8|nr:phenylalanine--tRNA ligase subunit beta [Curvibacter sp. CHRR-16]MBT0571207.1 phenylalanine--tRNA ligase subunit beta [Curvibacter sp. CHRR-16]
MQFSESWLRSFCNPSLSTQALADVLTMAGMEVEDLEPVAPPFHKIVVGEIKEAEQHPNADRLRVCKVDTGAELLTIVCGASNARVGIRVPCALVGAELPPGEDGKPFSIKVGKLRGVESYGMLCSARELRLKVEDTGGLLELPLDAPLGQDIREYLQLNDTLFTLKLTPNLAHCLSVYGVARELAALTGAPLVEPKTSAIAVTLAERQVAQIQAPDLCGRFAGRIVRGINPKAITPRWMVDRLARSGQRSVNALVDISNYVMFELGRPSHIFDLDKITGDLQVRWGRAGESLKLLNGSTITVDEQVGVVADTAGLESLAGIMGGEASAVGDETRNIYIEAAFWWPEAIAGRSRRFNFSTDAGHRFERGVDPASIPEHIDHITQLILDICGTSETQVGPIDDQVVNMPATRQVNMRVSRAAKIIGIALTCEQCTDVFSRLGLPFQVGGDVITVTVPSYRFDIQIEEDLVEEVVRIIGYNNLPDTAPLAQVTARIHSEEKRPIFQAKRLLASLGYQETINFSFIDSASNQQLGGVDKSIRLLNPIASQLDVMRSSIVPSLIQVLQFNLARKQPRLRIFEVGRVFWHNSTITDSLATVRGFEQPMRVAGLAAGAHTAMQWGVKSREVDFYDIKADVEALLAPLFPRFVAKSHPALHPGRSAEIYIDDQVIGFMGQLHPLWVQKYELSLAPIVFELDWQAVLNRTLPKPLPVSKYQSVQKDIAVLVPAGVTYGDLMGAIWQAPTNGLLQDATLFDIYKPQGVDVAEASWAIRLVLQSEQGNLTEAEIEASIQAILAQLTAAVGARLRA